MGVSISDGLTLLNTDEDITWGGDQTFNGVVNANDDIVMASGKGIDFSATADGSGTTTSEVFSDYEEGSFTPVLSDGTNNATSSIAVGNYTKIGNRVWYSFRITTTSLGSVSGAIRVTGLPFTSATEASALDSSTASFGGGLNITAGHTPTGQVGSNTAYVLLKMWDSTAGVSDMLESEWTADGAMAITGSYRTA